MVKFQLNVLLMFDCCFRSQGVHYGMFPGAGNPPTTVWTAIRPHNWRPATNKEWLVEFDMVTGEKVNALLSKLLQICNNAMFVTMQCLDWLPYMTDCFTTGVLQPTTGGLLSLRSTQVSMLLCYFQLVTML
jgi:hypothetical protein